MTSETVTRSTAMGGRSPLAEGTVDSPLATAVAAGDPRLDSWRAFLHAHARVTRQLDEELQAVHGLSLGEYDALLQLATAPGRRLRMSVLADRVLLSRSGITRLVDRLVAADMVERTTCSTDARGAEAALTAAGLERLRSAASTHLDGVRRLFIDVVEPNDREALGRALNRVLDNLGSAADAACAPVGGTA